MAPPPRPGPAGGSSPPPGAPPLPQPGGRLLRLRSPPGAVPGSRRAAAPVLGRPRGGRGAGPPRGPAWAAGGAGAASGAVRGREGRGRRAGCCGSAPAPLPPRVPRLRGAAGPPLGASGGGAAAPRGRGPCAAAGPPGAVKRRLPPPVAPLRGFAPVGPRREAAEAAGAGGGLRAGPYRRAGSASAGWRVRAERGETFCPAVLEARRILFFKSADAVVYTRGSRLYLCLEREVIQ